MAPGKMHILFVHSDGFVVKDIPFLPPGETPRSSAGERGAGRHPGRFPNLRSFPRPRCTPLPVLREGGRKKGGMREGEKRRSRGRTLEVGKSERGKETNEEREQGETERKRRGRRD